jgi:hypothetical protein
VLAPYGTEMARLLVVSDQLPPYVEQVMIRVVDGMQHQHQDVGLLASYLHGSR